MGGFGRRFPLPSNAAAQVLQGVAAVGDSQEWARANHQHGAIHMGDLDNVFIPAGYVGEIVSSSVVSSSAVTLTNNATSDITSIVLEAGKWLLAGRVSYLTDASVVPTLLSGSIETIDQSANTFRPEQSFRNLYGGAAPGAFTPAHVGRISGIMIQLSAQKTIYLNARANFTGGTLKAYGSLVAMRFA